MPVKYDLFTLQLDKAQRAALERMAAARGCAISVIVREAIEEKTGVASRIGTAGRPRGDGQNN